MEAFSEVAVLIGLAAFFGLIAHRLKQPLILGYIVAGVLLQVTSFVGPINHENLELFSKIGIVFLLFILGMDLDITELKKLGKVAFATGIGQIVFTVVFGMLIAMGLGYGVTPALYLAIALTFSSTIVVVKLLSQKRDLDTLYGKISVGFLLVQDFVAIILLIFLSAAGDGSDQNWLAQVFLFIMKSSAALTVLYIIDKTLLPWVIKLTGHDREVLFITMVAWSLVFAALVSSNIFGLSLEIGALAAGIALSARKETLQIESWTRPLRDFFITVFFVLLGFQVELGSVSTVIVPAIIFSVFVLIGNPLIVLFIMSLLKFPSKVGFFAGLTVAQISEFSLLVAAMGLAKGHITQEEITLLTIVGGVTMTLSSYMILYNERLYHVMQPVLKIFDFKRDSRTNYRHKQTKDRIVVFGFNRMAAHLQELIANSHKKFLVIDNDSSRIDRAEELGATVAFGDLKDNDLLTQLKLEQAEMIISTVPEYTANLNLIRYLKQAEIETPVIVTALDDHAALKLYEEGASFVLHPYLITSARLLRIIQRDALTEYLHRNSRQDMNQIKHMVAELKRLKAS